MSRNTPTQGPFDFTEAVRGICLDVCHRLDEFKHIDMSRVAVCFSQARTRVRHGLQAKLTPLRFDSGALFSQRHGQTWTLQRLFIGGKEMLYILTFYLPRFLDQTFDEKFITILHELYHISPRFDGDIRRFPGRCHVHSESQHEYDKHMAELVGHYLSMQPPVETYGFLKQSFRALFRRHGQIIGQQIPIPKLIVQPDRKAA